MSMENIENKLLGRISYKKHIISITILLKKYEYEYRVYLK